MACGVERTALGVMAGAFAVSLVFFSLERRERGWARCVALTASMTLAGCVVVPLAMVAAETQDPSAPSRWVHAVGSSLAGQLVFLDEVAACVLLGLVLTGWPLTRLCTTGVAAQTLVGGLSTLLVLASAGPLVGGSVDAVTALGALLAGLLGPALVARVERARAVQALDPARAGPTERDPRPVVAGWGLGALVSLAIAPAALSSLRGPPAHPNEREAVAAGTLRTISTSQTVFREGDEDGDGVLDHAASSAELGQAGLVDANVATGVKRGYLVRVSYDPQAPGWRWAAVMDPLDPRDSRRYMTNQSGVIFYTGLRGAPAALDRSCEPPAGWLPYGK